MSTRSILGAGASLIIGNIRGLIEDKCASISIKENKTIPLHVFGSNIITRSLDTNSGIYTWKYKDFTVFRTIQESPIRGLDKFYKYFGDSYYMAKVTFNNKDYYVAKGVVTDARMNPLVLVSFNLHPEVLEIVNNGGIYPAMNKKFIEVWLSRDLFTSTFKLENKRMNEELHTVIIPYLMSLEVPVHVRKNLNMWETTHIDVSKSPVDVNNEFKSNATKLQIRAIKELFPSHRFRAPFEMYNFSI